MWHVRIATTAVEKKSITYFECVSVALEVQHAKHMHRITLSSVACLALYIYRVAQKNVYTLRHEKHYSVIVTTVFIQKQN